MSLKQFAVLALMVVTLIGLHCYSKHLDAVLAEDKDKAEPPNRVEREIDPNTINLETPTPHIDKLNF